MNTNVMNDMSHGRAARGQTILEIVIALAIFIFIAGSLAALMLGGTNAAQQGSQHIEASALAQEGLEAVYAIRNRAWNELSQSPAGVALSAGRWVLSGANNTIAPFTRTITLDTVCRSAGGDITNCPGALADPHTLYATSTVTWTTVEGAQNSVRQSAYITSWDHLRWSQSDWSGGSGQNIWTAADRYASDDGKMNVTVQGQVQLASNIGSGTWSLHTQLGAEDTLRDVATVSDADMWAVGDDGLIAHYNGTAWSVVMSPYQSRINAVTMLSATSGWAVGDNGRILRYNGTVWSAVASPVSEHLNSISMISEIDGWAVGDAGKILHWNGTQWTEFTDTGGNSWHDVQMMSATNGWVVGNQGFIYHWNGFSWTLHTDSGGTVWRSVFLLNANDGWVVGDQGNIYRWNGSTWTPHTDTGGTNWRSVHLATASDGWITGTGGDIYRWNGTAWLDYPSPTTEDFNEVLALTSGNAWAVGSDGNIFRYQGPAYYTQGQVISSAFSMGDPSPVMVVEWDELVPSCTPVCDVRLQVRTAPDNSGAPGAFGPWYGATGSGSLVPVGANGNQWVQYQAVLEGDAQNTPTLSEVRIYYK